jgi:hypothetical protein
MVDWKAMIPVLEGVQFPMARSAVAEISRVGVRMTTNEVKSWLGHVLKSNRYLEWGAGGSTVLVSWVAEHLGRPEVHVTDSSRAFLWRLKMDYPLIDRVQKHTMLKLNYGDIGAISEWGNPAGWTNRSHQTRLRQARRYVESNGRGACCFDVVFVDGRFRNACLMHALSLVVGSSSVVMVHDSPRHLEFAKRYYDPISTTDTLTVMRPRQQFLHSSARNTSAWRAVYLNALDDRQRRR